ncbi:GNAT family N-acetyltransferase [bacterium]|nr:GNAT family N-acetyltransferase [bacterium]
MFRVCHLTNELFLSGISHPVGFESAAARQLSRFAACPEHVLLERKGRVVLHVPGNEFEDATLALLGKLRAEAFTAVGEGLGQVLDLDEYDRHYNHLIVWDTAACEILGAYRLTPVQRDGSLPDGSSLYTSTLYEYGPGFFERLGPAMELGRAFVSPRHQRSVEPLFLLWQGIGRIIERFPQFRYCLGAVSISKTYSAAARRMILQELWQERISRSETRVAGLPVRARRPARIRFGSKNNVASQNDPVDRSRVIESLATLDRRVRGVDPEGRGVPVLITRYLDLGGTFLAFHDDREFGSIACLAVLDLLQVPPRSLARFMGQAGAEALWREHGVVQPLG